MAQDTTVDLDNDILQLPGRHALEIELLRRLSRRADLRGGLHIALHAVAMIGTGTLVWLAQDRWATLVPAMALHGATIVTMFAPMHECVHKTAFKSPWLNNVVGWLAGTLCFYNFNYYRRYHTWHHRYTQDPARDPELSEPKPSTLTDYLVHLSGIPFWVNKPRELVALAWGRMEKYEFIPAHLRREIAWSARAQLSVYLAAAAFSIALRSPLVLYYWFLPALLAQPLLRALLIVEHTGCSEDANGLTNTRTTLASWPIRFLMWNMPFHAEHHLYPSIPFFRLPEAHASLRQKFSHVAPNYPAANFEVIRMLGPAAELD